jgi:chemotaxis protein CheX
VDQGIIIPFIKTTKNLFETMFQMPVNIGDPRVKESTGPSFDVSAIIGMSGDMEGAVVLSFPRVVSLFTGSEVGDSAEDLCDAVGELVNMIAGGAKAQFQGRAVSISCPSVVIGKDHVVSGRKDVVCLVIPCSCDCGEFNVEVAVRPSTKPAAAGATPATAAR